MHYRSLAGHSYLIFAALIQLSIAKLKQYWTIQAKWILRRMLKKIEMQSFHSKNTSSDFHPHYAVKM